MSFNSFLTISHLLKIIDLVEALASSPVLVKLDLSDNNFSDKVSGK